VSFGLSLCSIIVVTHNNLKFTRQCLESIIRITDYHPYELIVVDANSTDGTLEYLHSVPEVRLVHLEKNYPYSYSINRGIEAAKGDFLCFMNNDTIIVQPEWLSRLIECAKSDARIGIVGPRLCRQNLVDTRRNREGLPRYILPDGSHMNIWPLNGTVTPCTYVVGACFLVKRRLIDEIGLFDEGFFFNYDETDYCLRTWKAGRKVVCDTRTSVVHLVNKTKSEVTDKDYEYDIHNYEDPEKRFYRKHSSKDFERILRQAKGPTHFYLWKIRYNARKALDLARQGVHTQAR
jgi:GT2 family glycosyltransferase